MKKQDIRNYRNNNIWDSIPSKTSLERQYWYQVVQSLDVQIDETPQSEKHNIGILGFACDAGVRRNNGRVGAEAGPSAIRERLAHLAYHINPSKQVYDYGDVYCSGDQLEEAQETLSEVVATIAQDGVSPILLGGGHEIAFGHYRGLHKAFPDKTIGILNFDAHLDLRNPSPQGNSGTPFHQIHDLLRAEGKTFHYMPIGIQRYSNAPFLFDKADEIGTDIIFLEDISAYANVGVEEKILNFIQKTDYIYITIDLDGISSAYCPGVSAPSPLGLKPDWLYYILEVIFNSGKVLSCDLAEMNPQYDVDKRTAKFASELVDRIAHLY